MLREIADGIKVIMQGRLLQAMLTVAAVGNFALMGITALSVFYLVHTEGTPPGTAGLAIGAGSLGGILGATLATHLTRHLGDARTYLLANLVAAPFMLLLPLSAHGWRLTLYAAGAFITMTGTMMSNVITMTFRANTVPTAVLGRVTAASRFFVLGTIPLGAATAGFLASTLGVRAAMWTLACLYAVNPLMLLGTAARGLRELPKQDIPGGTPRVSP
jgi:MFS family permease